MYHFAIDRGGTFTDVLCVDPDGEVSTTKLLSVSDAYADAPFTGIQRMLEAARGPGRKAKRPAIGSVRMGTTVATNALLEGTGKRTALLVSRGLRDVLRLANMARPNIFDLRAQRARPVTDLVVEVDERIRFIGPDNRDVVDEADGPVVVGHNGADRFQVLAVPDEKAVRAELQRLAREEQVECIAIAFVHSYAYPDHEQAVARIARSLGCFTSVVCSSDMPMVRYYPRAVTAVVDASLTPLLADYTNSFVSNFGRGELPQPLKYITSDGGLVASEHFVGSRAVLSGPAGGLVGASLTAGAGGHQVIAFDMGGTSSDVSRYDGRALHHVLENEMGGVSLMAPMLDITTVAAGGGSLLVFRDGLFCVGPESAGANPGPVCYRRPGGRLAVTDANVGLGRVQPSLFPAIFGPNNDEPLDVEAARAAFAVVVRQVEAETGERMTVEEVACGFLRVANEAMARPIRAVTQARGHEPSDHVLAAFGGAGPQHVCALARELGCRRAFVHRLSGVLSALGIALADDVAEAQESLGAVHLDDASLGHAQRTLDNLADAATARLTGDGDAADADADAAGAVAVSRFLRVRYAGTDTSLMMDVDPLTSLVALSTSFASRHLAEFGFTIARPLLLDDARVRASRRSRLADTLVGVDAEWAEEIDGREEEEAAAAARKGGLQVPVAGELTGWPGAETATVGRLYEGPTVGWSEVPVVRWTADLVAPARVVGPAIVVSSTATLVVERGVRAYATRGGSLVLTFPTTTPSSSTHPTPSPTPTLTSVSLSVFTHRFMSIAEQMGKVLQRTAISTNIKERLDFSCAIFDATGNLVANAPHLPVHLGAMAEAVRFQLRQREERGWARGAVVASNHPDAGGSHLPDITVISPVFADPASTSPDFFVASRGHHADVGGSQPGSMPPFSTCLADEGIAFASVDLVDETGAFATARLESLFAESRARADVLADLRAQAAANARGSALLRELVASHSVAYVAAAASAVQAASARAVDSLLTRLLPPGSSTRLTAADRMDDGSLIRLAISRDPLLPTRVLFDFTGTSPQVVTNTNAPVAVTYAAIIYSLRALIDEEIPLNSGCLAAIRVLVPPGCLLHPSPSAPVVGGNVLTSQRITDVILAALDALAPSQGDMSNLTFGTDSSAYYETIGGGSGGGPTFAGASGTQLHMTNTRATDVEVLERRMPVVVRRFELRRGSGGPGKQRGGDGIVRELQFTANGVTGAILSERRSLAPGGLRGGLPALPGVNLLYRRRTDATTWLGGKAVFAVDAGDVVRIETPGGGGYGVPEEGDPYEQADLTTTWRPEG